MIYIVKLIDTLVNLFSLAILIRVILSWVRFDPYHPISVFIHQVTEPVLAPIRRYLPSTGMIDFSPLVALVLVQVVQVVLSQLLLSLY
ncbi:MAG: YggT family protein [Anaerolineae bacterium]